MSHPRITLSRILAVNWYGYRQFIDVAGLSLITGANGSGKSALLDLIQFVMLGEQQSRFNKAAAGAGSGRSLRGYCLCDTNTTGRDGQERYLRPSSVTLAALEFTWPLRPGETEPRRETWGARIEYESPSAKPSTIWFRAGRRLAWQDFLNSDGGPEAMQFLPEEVFRTRVKRELDGDVWDRQKAYLEEMALRSHLGFDAEQMGKTLPRAMAFEPESNFEKFVREFLLEPGMPDVRAVKASVDAHRRAQERLEKMHDQLERLKKISGHHQNWVASRRESALYTHLSDALKHEEALENLNRRRSILEERRAEHADNLEAHENALQERDRLRTTVEAARAALGDKALKLEENDRRRRELDKDIARLEAAASGVRDVLRDRLRRWQDWILHASRLGLNVSDEASACLAAMQSADETRALAAARDMTAAYIQLKDEAGEALRPIEARLAEHEMRKMALQKDLGHLQEGQAAPAPLLNALLARGQRAVALGRVVEVKPSAEKWWPLLEAMLGAHRRAILPEDFRAAWDQAQQTPSPGESLLHPDEVRSLPVKVEKGSLREFLETRHEVAGRYLDHLLGGIVAVTKVSQLDKHARALSLDGWLKDPPRRVKLTPEKELTLGEEGLRRLRDQRESELRDTEAVIEEVRRDCEDLRAFLNRGREWRLDHFTAPAGSDEIHQLPRLRRELGELQATWDLLATPDNVQAMENLRVQNATLEGIHERIGSLKTAITAFSVEQARLEDALAEDVTAEEQTRIARQTSRTLVRGINEAEIATRITAERQKSTSWRKAVEMAAALALRLDSQAQEARRLRDEERAALIEAHKDIGEALDAAEEGNDAFDQRREELETHELERYKTAAEAAKREWEERLQHQVLDVLREKLSEADRTKRELNRAMDHEIGGWRYQLTSRADKAHSAIWTLVEKGLPSGSDMDLFNAGAREDIERAKAELMAAIDAADNPDDKRHQRALDYRYYHHWDIEAKPAGRGDAAAISLNKSAKKQSGGENQAPFFVATLAAFRRVYDLGRRDEQQNLGLVVMDEAFSKLSGDRIDDCLALARNFGLQLIMAFPEDRLPTMFQHADTVVQCRVERTYDESTEQVENIENWVVRVEGSRLVELME
ncbi:MAG: Chromosome partition protein Smc [Prosthecobacter sp.]|nr:Chromosome partition protein Smc [Prosthecobacter sp.]